MLVAMLIVSCSKDTNSLKDVPDGAVQYKVNGNLFIIQDSSTSNVEHVMIAKQMQGTAFPRYIFSGRKEPYNFLGFGIESDSLAIRNYTYDSTSYLYRQTNWVLYNGSQSMLYYAGDNLTINITSYSNGFISGDFTAKFTPSDGTRFDYSKRGTTLITEGKFKNIKCVY